MIMGARVTRAVRTVNLENRAHREVAKAKVTPAPRHPTTPRGQDDAPEFREEVKKKDEHLLTLLKEVYVDSKDPPKDANKGGSLAAKQKEYRPIKVVHPKWLEVHHVPKGKIAIIEALTLLNNHQQSPQIWTLEKIADEYSLELKDVTSIVKYFIPFSMEVSPPEDKKALKSV